MLVQGKYGDAFGDIRGGHWGGLVGFGSGCTACAGSVCVHGDSFPPVKSVADKFMVFTHCFSGFWLMGTGFSVRLCSRCGWCGCSVVGLGSLGVTLGVFLVQCVFCRAEGFYPACWRGLMDDETSFHNIFLFMLLLIPFLVIGFKH